MQPNFFYGSLLAVFGIEIVADWLGRSWAKVSRAEYILLWLTFLSICQGVGTPLTQTHAQPFLERCCAFLPCLCVHSPVRTQKSVLSPRNASRTSRTLVVDQMTSRSRPRPPPHLVVQCLMRAHRRAVGLELGIAIGVALATMWFAFSYAQVHITSFAVVPSRSGAVRSAAQVRLHGHEYGLPSRRVICRKPLNMSAGVNPVPSDRLCTRWHYAAPSPVVGCSCAPCVAFHALRETLSGRE